MPDGQAPHCRPRHLLGKHAVHLFFGEDDVLNGILTAFQVAVSIAEVGGKQQLGVPGEALAGFHAGDLML